MDIIKKYDAIVIGVSAGGMKALGIIIPKFPNGFSLPVIIVQHREKDANDFLANYLNKMSNLQVKEAKLRESINTGTVYLAPGGYHLLIEDDKTFTFSVEPLVNFARPSIDVLFESAAYVYGENLIGVILTGANRDGAQGLKKIKEAGGVTIVQDPETAEYEQMPRAAIQATKVDHILNLNDIAPYLIHLEKGRGY